MKSEPLDLVGVLDYSLDLVSREERDLLSEHQPKIDRLLQAEKQLQKKDSMSIDSAKINRLMGDARIRCEEEEKEKFDS